MKSKKEKKIHSIQTRKNQIQGITPSYPSHIQSPIHDLYFPFRILFVFLFFLLFQCQSNGESKDNSYFQNKEKTKTEIQKKWETLAPSGIKSLTYMVMMGDGEVYQSQIGVSSEAKIERFKIGSITKLFTGIAILQLQESGKLKLDDPASKFLPELNLVKPKQEGYREITIRDLLTHQSGLPSDLANGFFLSPEAKEDEIYRSFRSLPKSLAGLERNEPGKIHSYSNLSFGLLGNIIERVSGASIESYFRIHIFEKAGMKHTTLLEELADSDLITGYSGIFWKTKTIRPVIRDLTAGSISTTAGDMGLFMKSFFQSKSNKGLLSAVSFDEFHKTQNGPFANFEMKLGLPVMKTSYMADGKTVWFYGHSGSLPPFFADLLYDPETEIVSFVAGNTLGLQTGGLKGTNTEVMEIVWEEKMGVRPEPILLPVNAKKGSIYGEEGYYISTMGIHEYKNGNPPTLSLMGFDVGLIPKENRFGIDLRVFFGLIPIRDPKIEEMRIEFETWEGNSIFTLYNKDLPKGVAGIGVKFTPNNRFPEEKYFGTFVTKENYAIIPKLKLEKDKRGFPLLTIYYALGGMENTLQVPCEWEGEGTIRILGYGRNLGERFVLSEKDGKPVVLYSGGVYEKD
ncbi:serine hydrolase domain-containing protein [Leptospira levettii]|uniref:Beta-lactamase family protein n=1 Tax=Leptospira levettii TaxID=2023178 RepID=A0AAW5V8Y2_9LEPT|nr:serine hydrolase domain-containing protein [Leptospira levettii]MCW7464802.1 beta-lactamase family protein [Leptospira levettii]MCW7511014.1 beta-lactamase family protein [Leptospira levettii]MCW7514768.1 beta-lactamase family protein [Leptospira levettii]